ncbi:MAG TPA: dynamin family protein [Candidatus Acidoferrales bacterium]|nr:dynamin family protein [Candidatus Acidoferrales bacterium]
MIDQAGPGGAAPQETGQGGALRRLAEIAGELGSDRIAEEAKSLAERLAEGRFYVVCVGQFKRGKSTLLDAIVGDRVLPTGILPVTSVPTVVRWGRTRSARVRFRGGNWLEIPPDELTQYVSEEFNPENTKGVAGVEVFVPSPLLSGGMCLVDTPGVGSIFAGNTAATQAFVPHVDAAIFVVGADPPISGEELALAGQVGKHVRNLIIVLNKADRTSDSEREMAKSFTKQALEKRLGRPVGSIYEVSAEDQLQARGPERDWGRLIRALENLVRESGRSLVSTAGERGVRRFTEELLSTVSEEREALARPLEESERRIQRLGQTISEAERSLRELGYRFTAEEQHLSDTFLTRRKAFIAEAVPQANAELDASLARLRSRFGPKFRRDAMRAAQMISERRVLPWLEQEQVRAEEEYLRVALRFVEIGNGFLKKLSETSVPELALMPHALDSETCFRVPSGFRFEGLITIAQPASPLRYMADAFLGLVGALFSIKRDAHEFLEHLMETNSTRVQSDLIDRVQESRRLLEVEIRQTLREVIRIAERALDHARRASAEGAAAIQAAVARFEVIENELRNLPGRIEISADQA